MADHGRADRRANGRRRQPVVRRHKGNDFKRAVRQFNRCLAELFPVDYRTDVRGRRRPVGQALRKNAQTVLWILVALQAHRGALIFISWADLGRRFHASRSTAYRACLALERANLIVARERGGGKRIDENGQVTNRANGYELHPELQAPEEDAQHQGRRRARKSTNGQLGPQGARMDAMGKQWVAGLKDTVRAARPGPAP